VFTERETQAMSPFKLQQHKEKTDALETGSPDSGVALDLAPAAEASRQI
jgi:hypothetical protein